MPTWKSMRGGGGERSSSDRRFEAKEFSIVYPIWQWVKNIGYLKTIGRRKHRPKPVVCSAFLFDP